MRKKYKMFLFFFSVGIMMIGCVTLYIGRGYKPPRHMNTEVGTEGKDNQDEGNAAGNTGDKADGTAKLEITDKDGKYVLEENMYPEINEVVEKYLNASVVANMDVLSTVVSDAGRIDRDALREKYRYVEKFENISCYTLKTPEEGGYRVYAYVEMKLSGIDTLAPGLSSLYVTKTDKGNYCVYLDVLSRKVQKFIDAADESEPVKKLVEQVNYRFEEALGKNEELKRLHEQMSKDN